MTAVMSQNTPNTERYGGKGMLLELSKVPAHKAPACHSRQRMSMMVACHANSREPSNVS